MLETLCICAGTFPLGESVTRRYRYQQGSFGTWTQEVLASSKQHEEWKGILYSCENLTLFLYLLDQLRYQALGFAGDPNVRTPHLDRLAGQSVSFSLAVSGAPVCSPARASLLTGQYPHRHGVFVNDVHLGDNAASIAQVFASQGYDTGYIGKWHLNGGGRSNCIPQDARQGFDFWRVLECTHNYNESYYYADESPVKKKWDGYDVIAQTDTAVRYIQEHGQG